MKSRHLISALALLALMGAGCSPSNPSAQPQPSASSTVVMEIPATSTPPTPTSTPPEPPKVWARTGIANRSITFTPPKGYWVHYSLNNNRFYLVPGTAPKPGAPDPELSAMKNAVASFYEVQDDITSFPNWRRFGITMAQFDCAQGTSDADFINCGEPTKEVEGKTEGLYPYTEFTMPAALQATRASRGSRTYFVVRLGDRTFGILVAVVNGKSAAPAAALVKSIKGN